MTSGLITIARRGEIMTEDDAEVPVPPEVSNATSKPQLISSRSALAQVALHHALGAAGRRELNRGRLLAIVLQVPSEQWCDPIAAAVRELASSPITFTSGSDKPRTRNSDGTEVAMVLARGGSVVGISPTPTTRLPDVLLASATHTYTVTALSGPRLLEAMKLCLVGRAPRDVRDLDLTQIDFDTLGACLARGTTKSQAITRLRRALGNTSRAQVSELHLPRLEDAVEYGSAREWGLSLKKDIEDLRAGIVTWRDVDRGILLEGPPGSGKTTFAQILGASCGLETIVTSVADMFASSAGYLDSVIKAQRKVFAEAAAAAPCILFLDEINALPDPANLSARGRDWWMPVILDFYMLLDSATSARDGVVVVGATNRKEDISGALLRPGRLERSVHIGSPSSAGLVNVLRTHLGDDLKGVDLLPLARIGEGATAAVVMEWVRSARRASRRAGRDLRIQDLRQQVMPTDGRLKSERYRCAIHEAGHAVAGLLLGQRLESVSIMQGLASGGTTTFSDDAVLFDTQTAEARAKTLLAGLAAEVLVCGSASSGAGGSEGSDLARATDLLGTLHTSFGMRDDMVYRGRPESVRSLLERDPQLRSAVEADLKRLYAEVRDLVGRHRSHVLAVAARLMKSRVLFADQVREVIGQISSQIQSGDSK
jgi:cell division protease FtsH